MKTNAKGYTLIIPSECVEQCMAYFILLPFFREYEWRRNFMRFQPIDDAGINRKKRTKEKIKANFEYIVGNKFNRKELVAGIFRWNGDERCWECQ